jgi:ferredoxin
MNKYHALTNPRIFPMFKRALFEGWDSRGSCSDEKCYGCGACEKVYPTDNITVAE